MEAVQLELPGMTDLNPAGPPQTDVIIPPKGSIPRSQLDTALVIEDTKLLCAPEDLAAFSAELARTHHPLPNRVNVDPEDVERGLSQLVLTVIELLRQLMERQALRRMEAGTLDDEQIERLGQAFMKLEQRMAELKEIFGLSDDDLNIDLGPLGKLLS